MNFEKIRKTIEKLPKMWYNIITKMKWRDAEWLN